MKLWAGRFQKETDDKVNDFNSSISFDARLYRQDIAGSIAHATMLGEQGIIAKEEADKIVADAGYSDTIDDVQQALDADGNALGYVITVTAKDGSQGSITFSVGIQNDGTVNGYSITDISETPGLGMKAEEEDFYSQFQNKKVDNFTVVKNTPSSDDEIEAITGSTITSKAMANGCNAAICYFQNGGLSEVSANE